ncbi:MAG: ATP-binding protein [Pseudomonadota bacterium]
MTPTLPPFSTSVILAGVAGVLAGVFGVHLTNDAGWIKFFDNLHWSAGTGAAATLGWLGVRAAQPGERAMRRWIAWGLTGYAVGQLCWDIQIYFGHTGFPAPSDLFYLWLGPMIALGLVIGGLRATQGMQRRAFVLDVLALSVAILALVLAAYLPKRGETGLLPLAVMIAYPVTLLGAACVVLVLVPALRLRMTPGWLLFTPSLLVTGWSWMTWNSMALDGTIIDGAWFNGSFSFAVLGLGISSLRLTFEPSDNPAWDRLCEGMLRLLPLLTVVAAAFAVVLANTLQGVPDIVRNIANYGSVSVIMLATMRQVMLLEERDQLLAEQAARKQAEAALQLSEERWKFALEGAGDGVWDWDLPSGSVFFSDRWKSMIGYGRDEFENTYAAWERNVHPDDLPATLATLKKYMAGESPAFQVEFRMRCKDGGWKWILGRGMVVRRGEDGRPLRMIGTHADITARKNMEEAIRQNEARLHHMLETSPIAVRIANEPWQQVLYANARYADLIGINASKVKDSRPEGFYARPDEYDAIRKQLADGEKILNRLVELNIPGQGKKWVLASYMPMEYGNAPAILGWFYDITERKNMEVELRNYRDNLEQLVRQRTREAEAAREAAERANRAKSEFLSRMSHELRTPLNAILGFSQLLESAPLDQHNMDYVGEIHQAGNHLLELINDLLDLSRVEAGHLEAVLKVVPLAPLIEHSIHMVQPLIEQHTLTLNNTCQHAFNVLADETRLTQILVNLLSNAAKYNRRSGKITIACEALDAETLRLSIADTGYGIPPEKLDLLFVPFERLGAEFTSVEGTGIGLALSKQLAGLMNARLGASSVIGRGSTFWIDLPLARLPAMPGDKPVPPAQPGSADGKALILYIEDNATNIKVVESVLNKYSNMSLISAGQGSYGLELAARYLPAVILLDIHLPDMDGYTVLERLRARPETSKIPVVALTADAMPADITRGLAAGFHSYLTKPLRIDELLRTLAALVPAPISNG